MKSSASRGGTGFALVELVVVIAILAILAAILLPVSASVREKARQGNCASNERQLGLAVQQYVEDNDYTFPDANSWVSDVYPYTKSLSLYSCPDDEFLQTSISDGLQLISYAYNQNLSTGVVHGNLADVPQRLYTETSPPLTVMLFECSQAGYWASSIKSGYGSATWGNGNGGISNSGPYATGPMAGAWNQNGNLDQTFPKGRHAGSGSNFLLSDGHVQFFQGSSVSAGYSADTPTTASPGSGSRGPFKNEEAGGTSALPPGVVATFSLN